MPVYYLESWKRGSLVLVLTVGAWVVRYALHTPTDDPLYLTMARAVVHQHAMVHGGL